MALRERVKESNTGQPDTRGSEKGGVLEETKDNNEYRRKKYNNDTEYRELVKKRSRETYYRSNVKKKSSVRNGLLESPTSKEVISPHYEDTQVADVYTIGDAAKALGKSSLTLKRWIREGIIPPPILQCTVYGYRHYSVGELNLIAKQLATHEKEYSYLHHTHDSIINTLWQAIEAYRKDNI